MVLSVFGSIAEAVLRCMSVVAGYVTNSSTFPQPLSEEEEAKCLAKLQNGDEEARAILIERNLRLVAHIVNASASKLQVELHAAVRAALRVVRNGIAIDRRDRPCCFAIFVAK